MNPVGEEGEEWKVPANWSAHTKRGKQIKKCLHCQRRNRAAVGLCGKVGPMGEEGKEWRVPANCSAQVECANQMHGCLHLRQCTEHEQKWGCAGRLTPWGRRARSGECQQTGLRR